MVGSVLELAIWFDYFFLRSWVGAFRRIRLCCIDFVGTYGCTSIWMCEFPAQSNQNKREG